MAARWIIGDVHGEAEKLERVLRENELVDDSLGWAAGDAELWFAGDFTDRGPAGLRVLEIVTHLAAEAPASGGSVDAVLGNHDLMLLAVRRFAGSSVGEAFGMDWLGNGGRPEEAAGLPEEHERWLLDRPAVGRSGDDLVVHCDSRFYVELGDDLASANDRVRSVLAGDDPAAWEWILYGSFRRFELDDRKGAGARAIEEMLGRFGGTRIVHGHTPIPLVTDVSARRCTGPYSYSGGRCLNVDGGMFLGGPGFAVRLDEASG